jgi:chromosomal replication initiation ATPase DnaA
MLQQPLPLFPVSVPCEMVMGESNRIAVRTVCELPWMASTLYLYGEAGCGKTMLASRWAAAKDALWLEAADLSAQWPHITTGHYVLEQPERAEANALFHLLNIIEQTASRLLLCSRLAPSSLPFTLPDVTSRLRALPTAPIFAPDDELMQALLWQHCVTRQLRVHAGVLDYVLARIPRSYAVLQEVAVLLDTYSLNAKRPITLPLARQVLADYISP